MFNISYQSLRFQHPYRLCYLRLEEVDLNFLLSMFAKHIRARDLKASARVVIL